MPLFFFHLRTGEHLDADTVGIDLPDRDAARLEAYRAIADLLCDAALTGEALQGDAIEISDQDGQLVITVRCDVQCNPTRAG